jgi:AAA domain
MPFHRPRLGDATFAGRFFHPRPAEPPPNPGYTPAETSAPAARQADLVYLADIEPCPLDWLWQDRLAAGTLSMLSGNPGSGKTWLALAIAAALSRGHVPACTDPAPGSDEPCTILYASTHNAAPELIRPRFAALNGDPARLALLRGIFSAGSAQPAALNLRDLPILEDALQRTHARLLIIDPLHSYLWANDSHRAGHAARAFDNLARLADKHRCCILLVRHLRKRGRGSTPIELSAAVRTEFLAGSSPDAPAFPALVQIKSNLGPLAPSLGYTIDPTGAFSWTGPSNLTPEDVQADRPIGAGLPRRKQAADWLRQHLHDGPLTQGAIEAAAHRDAVCMITIRRAKGDLGILSTKSTLNGCWYWSLPQTGGAKK